jgi:hypothetical protein
MAEREADGKRGGRMAAMESLGWQRSVHAGGGIRRDYRDIHDLAVRPRAALTWRPIPHARHAAASCATAPAALPAMRPRAWRPSHAARHTRRQAPSALSRNGWGLQ